MGLCLHCGSNHATIDEVRAVPLPEMTESWVPVAHADVLEKVRSEIIGLGMQVTAQDFGLWNGGDRFFAVLDIQNGHNEADYGLLVAIRNSMDKSFPIGIALGSHVFCCDNLALSGEVVLHTRHTLNVRSRLPVLISRAVGMLIEQRHVQTQRIEAYKNWGLDHLHAHDLIVRAVRNKVICPSVVGKVLSEWDDPSFDDFLPRTVWSLFNAFTHILKEGNPLDLPKKTMILHGLCDGISGLAFSR